MTPQPTRKWVMPALAVSAAINIFIIGLMLGQAVKNRDFPPPPALQGEKSGALTLRRISRFLPEKDRDEIRKAARERLRNLRPYAMERRRIQRRIRDLLAAPDLDLDALDAEMERLKEVTITLREGPQDLIFDILPRLSLEQRRELAANLFKRRKKKRLKAD